MKKSLSFAVLFSLFALTAFSGTAHARCTVLDYETFSALDSDGDGGLYPIDFLTSVVNPQNAGIFGKRVSQVPSYRRLDLNHDGYYSPIDLLYLINMWNAGGRGSAGCDASRLRAYSKLDKAKMGTRIDSNEYLATYYMIEYGYRAERNHKVPLINSQRPFDFNRDGKVDGADADAVKDAYSRR